MNHFDHFEFSDVAMEWLYCRDCGESFEMAKSEVTTYCVSNGMICDECGGIVEVVRY